MMTFWQTLNQPFMWSALAAAVITAVTCAYLGVFVVLKRVVFVSVALAETAGLGVALGYFLGLNFQLTAFALTFLATVLFWHHFSRGRNQRESLVGLVYCLAAAVGVILLAKNPLAHVHGLDMISGNFLYARRPEIITLGFVAGLVLVSQRFFAKEFMAVSFDPDFARSTGLNASLWDFLLYLSLGLVISLSMRISGLIFVFGSLLVPALFALRAGGKTRRIFARSVVFALVCTVAGFAGSFAWDLPTAPTVVALYGVVYFAGPALATFRRPVPAAKGG